MWGGFQQRIGSVISDFLKTGWGKEWYPAGFLCPDLAVCFLWGTDVNVLMVFD